MDWRRPSLSPQQSRPQLDTEMLPGSPSASTSLMRLGSSYLYAVAADREILSRPRHCCVRRHERCRSASPAPAGLAPESAATPASSGTSALCWLLLALP